MTRIHLGLTDNDLIARINEQLMKHKYLTDPDDVVELIKRFHELEDKLECAVQEQYESCPHCRKRL